MSFINTIKTAYECGPLGECEFTIEFEYEPEDEFFGEGFGITEVRVLVPAVNGDVWMTLKDWSFTNLQEEEIAIQAAEMYAKHKAALSSDDDRIDDEYENWKERQLYREVE